jgi:hypothetical protein
MTNRRKIGGELYPKLDGHGLSVESSERPRPTPHCGARHGYQIRRAATGEYQIWHVDYNGTEAARCLSRERFVAVFTDEHAAERAVRSMMEKTT